MIYICTKFHDEVTASS